MVAMGEALVDRHKRVLQLALLALLLVIPLIVDSYTQYMLNMMVVYVTIAIGLNMTLGYAGFFVMSSAAITGVGAYAAALLTTRVGLSFWLALPAAGLIGAAIGALCVIPALRMKRVYLAMATVAFAELLTFAFVHWKGLTLGTDGVGVIAPSFFGWKVVGDLRTYYVVLAVTVVMYLAAKRLLQTKIGRSLVAVRENELVAQANGISIAHTKLIALIVGSFYSAVGGALYALVLGFVVPDAFGLSQMALQLSIVFVGGVGTLAGSVLGSSLMMLLPELLREFRSLQEIIYGLTMMACLIFMPRGIAGALTSRNILGREILAAVRPPTAQARRRDAPTPTLVEHV